MPKSSKKAAHNEDFRQRLADRARKFEDMVQQICALQRELTSEESAEQLQES